MIMKSILKASHLAAHGVALLGILGMIACSGCASIVSKSNWPVSVTSTPSGANFAISDNRGVEIQKGITPATIILPSSSGYFSGAKYHCAFEKDGFFKVSSSFSAHVNGWYAGNILFGGLIGLLIVDPATGSMWKLDDKHNSNLQPDPNYVIVKTNEIAPIAVNSTPMKIWVAGKHHKLWLLVIGVGQYKDQQIPKLSYAKQDAERIRDWALKINPDKLTRENISIITDEQATRVNFLAQIDWMRKQALPEDAILIYFAGHGAPELATDGKEVDAKYLLLYDANPDELFATGFSLDDLTHKLDTVKAKTQVVILEACYTGPVGQSVMKKTPTADLEIRSRFMQEMGERGGRVILSASTGRQMAIGSETIQGGLFTHYLLTSWGDGGKSMLIGGFDDAREQVQRAANKLGSTQEPVRFGDQNVDIQIRP